ncbi:hypothetical protein SRHO_G00242830 [Serrasalmus rhombeus]
MSFMALIDSKTFPVSKKMLYLKNYLAGEARKAVKEFFYRNSEDAYLGAWTVLQERYGNQFIVQKVFRDKLMKWPKINANDPFALREFSDFLRGCVEAIPHIRGLVILNDCEENHKLLKKLPEWIVRRWSRIVVDELDTSGNYPSFASFTEFVQKEAWIAFASPLLMSTKFADERLPKRAKTFNTSAQTKNSTTVIQKEFQTTLSCLGKLILQELCHRSIGWDDSLPEDLQPWWEEWINGLQTLREITISRCYHPQDFGNIVRIELHHFSDASNVGYGACSYLRYKSDRDEVHCCLVMAKARVAPTKVTSIPRLELSAAVVAAKVSVMLKTELEMKIDEEFFWTDSQVVLAYINNESRMFHGFVANRVQLIRENTDPSQWGYENSRKPS